MRISADEISLQAAAARLRAGELVAFPTETVYGLGASIACETALDRVFLVKGRPHTDPLIVHVTGWADLEPLVCMSHSVRKIARVLVDAFWPGPLTLVLPASPGVSMRVRAGGMTVGVRCPQHPIARRLLELAGVPVAAPSANRFAHVSPTSADHVLNDLGATGVWVVDGGRSSVGIESTVVSVTDTAVTVLRFGAVTAEALRECLRRRSLFIDVMESTGAVNNKVRLAPGQFPKHYSPDRPAAVMCKMKGPDRDAVYWQLNDCAVVDFGAKQLCLRESVAVYRDLSPTASLVEAAYSLYAVMRELESLSEVKYMLFPDIMVDASVAAEGQALAERILRACEGRRCIATKDFAQVFS